MEYINSCITLGICKYIMHDHSIFAFTLENCSKKLQEWKKQNFKKHFEIIINEFIYFQKLILQ